MTPTGVVWDLGNVLIDWDPHAAIAAGVGAEEARRFLDTFDFRAWNHGPDSGGVVGGRRGLARRRAPAVVGARSRLPAALRRLAAR